MVAGCEAEHGAVAREHAPATVFTCFVPASHPAEGERVWQRYWQRWPTMTLSQLGSELVGLLSEPQALCPPASVFDKRTYSPWRDGKLHAALSFRGCRTLIVTGGEFNVRVLVTVSGAIDLGYRVIVVTDALCSSADETHDAVMTVYHHRYGQRV